MQGVLLAMSELVGPESRALVQKFSAYDVDGAGTLDAAEFDMLYRKLMKQQEVTSRPRAAN